MKKNYLVLLLVLAVSISHFSYAQVARQFVLLEQANNTTMPVCSYFVDITSDIESAVPNVSVISYHNMDPFYTPESDARLMQYYDGGDQEYPAFWVDGTRIPYFEAVYDLQGYVEDRTAVASNFSIELSETHTGNNYNASVVVTKEANFPNQNMVLRLVLKETNIYYEWSGWEGEIVEQVDNVVRDMIPDENGTDVDLSAATSQTINLDFTIDPDWDRDNCELVAYLQDTDTEEVLQATKLSLAIIEYNYDASLSDISEPQPSICDNTISPIVVLKNKGGEQLISLDIEYFVEDETPMTYLWTGSLSFNERQEVSLPDYIFNEEFNKQKTLTISCSNPNGHDDENTSNDEVSGSFTQAQHQTNQLILELKTDQFGEDTSWELTNSSGEVVASGGDYVSLITYTEIIDIPTPDCYTFTMYDAYGDGIWPPGYYILSDINNNIIAENGDFSTEESVEFNVALSVGLEEVNPREVSIYPNPCNGKFYVYGAEDCIVFIYDMLGNLVYKSSMVSSNEKICPESLNRGSYSVMIKDKQSVSFHKLIISK